MKHLTALCLATAAACGNVTFPDEPAPGDDAAPTDPMGPDAGMIDPPIDPATLSIVPRAVLDERADAIAFSSGEPVHTHTGPAVMLGSAGCPDLARYAYLLDRQPVYGEHAAPNPLAITVALPEGLVADSAQYRIHAGGDSLSPWLSVPGSAGERATIALYRDDIPALGTFDGEIRVEVRARITGGVEQTASACWTHHPLNAPLAIAPPQPAAGPGSLGAILLTGTEAFGLLPAGAGYQFVDAFTIDVEQQTPEPLRLEVKPDAPAGTYSVTIADTYAQTQTSSLTRSCETEEAYCDTSPLPEPADIARAGALGSGSWVVYLREEGALLPIDCPAGACTIAARAAGVPARRYQVVVTLRGVGDLWPVATTATQMSAGGHAVVGGWLTANKQVRCKLSRIINGIAGCVSWVEYTELHALDRARLQLAATRIRLAAARGTSAAFVPVPHLAGSAVTAPAFTWDGGDGPL